MREELGYTTFSVALIFLLTGWLWHKRFVPSSPSQTGPVQNRPSLAAAMANPKSLGPRLLRPSASCALWLQDGQGLRVVRIVRAQRATDAPLLEDIERSIGVWVDVVGHLGGRAK